MQTITVYFDDARREVEPEQATWAQELTLDEQGKLVKSRRFVTQNSVAEFNPYHDALGRFATGPGMHAPDTGGGGGGEPPQRGALDTAEGLQRSITSGVKADRELGGLGDTHAFEVHFIDYNDGSRGVLKPAELTEVYDTAVGETLAYEVDQAIGLGMVPATVMVEYAGKPASLQRFVPDARTAREHGWEYEQQGHRAVMAAFDSVIQNPDRNSGNFMIRGDHSLVLIDHGLCLDSGYGHPDSGYGYNPRDAAKILHESVKGLGDYGEPVRAFVGKIRDLDMKQAATRVSARNPKLPKEAVDSVFVRLRELRDAYVEIERGGA